MWGESGSYEGEKRRPKGKWAIHSKDVIRSGTAPNTFFLFWPFLSLPSQCPCQMVDEAMSHYHREVGVTVSKAEVEVWSGVG